MSEGYVYLKRPKLTNQIFFSFRLAVLEKFVSKNQITDAIDKGPSGRSI